MDLFVLADYSEPFVDVLSHWSKSFVDRLYELGVVAGKGDGNFYDPEGNLTRAELTKIAILSFDKSILETAGVTFSDVYSDSWYYRYVSKAFNLGVISGYEDGNFRPDAPVNRAEALKILILSAGLDASGISESLFSDVNTQDWYAPYVSFAFKSGVVTGKSMTTFAPNDFVTRAEMAKMTVKTLELIGEH